MRILHLHLTAIVRPQNTTFLVLCLLIVIYWTEYSHKTHHTTMQETAVSQEGEQ